MRRVLIAVFALAAALCAVLPAGAAAVTLSDGFALRETVTGVPQAVAGTTVGAGRETGEPVPNQLSPAGHSVWLQWDATEQGYYTLSTCGSAVHTVLGVYSGSELSALNEVGGASYYGNPDCSPVRNGFTFQVFSTGNYQVLVDGNNFFPPPAPEGPPPPPPVTEGPVSLRIEKTPTPANDDFGNAEPVMGTTYEELGGRRFYFASVFGYDWAATKQAGEPEHGGDFGGASVWYSWTAPETGLARIDVCCGSAPNLLGVYTGDSLAALNPVQSRKGSAPLQVPVTAGTTYRIAVDGENFLFLGTSLAGSFNLQIGMDLPPGSGSGGGGSAASSSSASPSPPADGKPPKTTISKRKVNPGARKAVFFFGSDEAGSAFRCKLDGRKAAACSSPMAYSGLGRGSHTFKVYALDAAGNADPTPATTSFAIPARQRHR
jgi:hypothetical protein